MAPMTERGRTIVIPRESVTSGPLYSIGLKHGREHRHASNPEAPEYMNGWAAGYAQTRNRHGA